MKQGRSYGKLAQKQNSISNKSISIDEGFGAETTEESDSDTSRSTAKCIIQEINPKLVRFSQVYIRNNPTGVYSLINRMREHGWLENEKVSNKKFPLKLFSKH